MDQKDLERLDRMMAERDHSVLLNDESKHRNLLGLADEVPGLVNEVRALLSEREVWKEKAEELEEAHEYAQKVYEDFLRDWFPGEEGKTWAPGFTSRKFVEMIHDRFESTKLRVLELSKLARKVKSIVATATSHARCNQIKDAIEKFEAKNGKIR